MSSTDPARLLPPSLCFIERDWLSANHVIGFDDNGVTMVDTGYAKHAALTLDIVEHTLRARGHSKLKRIINTHLHSDHCGGNAALKARYGSEIVIASDEWNAVATWDALALSFSGTGQRCEQFVPDSTYRPGETLHFGAVDWQVLQAPGHDPHSTMLYAPREQILISADALWENGFGITFPECVGQSGFKEQAAVLDLISGLAIKLVIPGHGGMFTDVNGAIERARSRLQAMLEDPSRNNRALLKVLVKFALLDEERIFLSDMAQRFSHATYVVSAAEQLNLSLDAALRQTVDSLVQQGQIRLVDNWVMN